MPLREVVPTELQILDPFLSPFTAIHGRAIRFATSSPGPFKEAMRQLIASDDDDDDDFQVYSPSLGLEDLCRGFPKCNTLSI
jgi:hypothetical protein